MYLIDVLGYNAKLLKHLYNSYHLVYIIVTSLNYERNTQDAI